MELKNFIENILVDIAEGVTAARNRVGDKIAINPASVDGDNVVKEDYINFDIAVTVNEGSESNNSRSIKGGAKISVIAANADNTKESLQKFSAEKISRVSFRVPVYYGATFNKNNSSNRSIKAKEEYEL